jgi:DNA-binding NarL/FixJ family response regulator
MSPGIARRLLQLAASLSTLPDVPPSSSASLKEMPPPAIDLSPRERDVLELIAVGCTNKEVANKLGLSVHTIDFYAKRLYTKLSANSRTQAVNLARASGLLE